MTRTSIARGRRRRPALAIGTTTACVALLTLAAPATTSSATPAAHPALGPPRAESAQVAVPALDQDDLTWVQCPQGAGSIGVAPWIADELRELLREGLEDGVPMCGGGWRSHQRQVELRFQNCGVSTKAVYEWPARWCTPPTARPGRSMHEKGLAVDFRPLRGVSRQGMYAWLREHAPRHGLYQLPSENWHYSTTGG